MKPRRSYDVIIVGAGPGGSSTATFLARQGRSVLLLDKAQFPRDKVCGDGLTPQAIYWLDALGCAEQVLGQTKACITAADLYVDGEHILTGRLPKAGRYPGFITLLERRKLDDLLVKHATAQGAEFRPRHHVRQVAYGPEGVWVEADAEGSPIQFKGRLLIGADGANSAVARALGNAPRAGTVAVSLRAYYDGVKVDHSPFKVYFNPEFFPGYGWVFVDDTGRANIGVGVAADPNFPRPHDLKATLANFVATDLKKMLSRATPVGQPAGWWESFYRPGRIVDDGVMLVGDAANLADPMNGGGIAKAIESACHASQVAARALAGGDCSAPALAPYAQQVQGGVDWRIGELFLAFAKNPDIAELNLFFLEALGRLAQASPGLQDYCVSFFTELTPRSALLSPFALMDVVPIDPRAWLGMARRGPEAGFRQPLGLALWALQSGLRLAGGVLQHPLENVDWGLEVLEKALGTAAAYADNGRGAWVWTQGALDPR